MSAVPQDFFQRFPMPQLVNWSEPTDDDLGLYADYMQRVARAKTDGFGESSFLLGVLQAGTEQLSKWLKARNSENTQLRRERDNYRLIAEPNLGTVRSMIAARDAADEVRL